MTALAKAAQLLEQAAAELDTASRELRRIGNTRKVLGDADPEPPMAA